MKKRKVFRKRLLYVLVLIISLSFISASPEITTSKGANSFSVNPEVNYLYNITINNIDTGPTATITQVNITLPDNFIFSGIANTNTPYEDYVNIDNILSWSSSTSYLINENERGHFWFVAKTNITGDYNVNIITLNGAGPYTSIIPIKILSITCVPDWDCTPWSNCSNNAQTRYCTDLNACEDSSKHIRNRFCTPCTPNWICTDWSECIGDAKIRSCVDSNLCGNLSSKPTENKGCQLCKPNWECSEWEPKQCQGDQIQTRRCSDSDNCGESERKPSESRKCASKRNSILIFWILVIIILTISIIVAIMILELLRKPKENVRQSQNKNQMQNNPSDNKSLQ